MRQRQPFGLQGGHKAARRVQRHGGQRNARGQFGAQLARVAVAHDDIARPRLENAAAPVRHALAALQHQHQAQAVAAAIKALPNALRQLALQAP